MSAAATDTSVSTTTRRTVALVGNPNVGKTSLFNALTGLRAKTANYPGITVDLRQGQLQFEGHNDRLRDVQLIDLPGMYSLEPTSPEEKVASDRISGRLDSRPDVLVVVVDSTNLARNLFLATEVLELGRPTVVALGLIDAANAADIRIEVNSLSKQLECPIVPLSAKTGEGLTEFRRAVAQLLVNSSELPVIREACTAGCTGCSFAARHDFTELVCRSTVSGGDSTKHKIEGLDRLLTAPIVGLAALLTVMLTVFFMIFSLADVPMTAIEDGFGWIGASVHAVLPTEPVASAKWFPIAFSSAMAFFALGYRVGEVRWSRWSTGIAVVAAVGIGLLPLDDFRSLALDGVIGGIGGVVVFLPQICILFFFITLLEDSGYLARAAFVMERLMRHVGLPGKAFVPMLSAHACAIPGIMAARTIENWRDRLVTILVLPLLTCSARLPVYAMTAALLFGDEPLKATLMFAAAYLLGVVAAFFSAFCLKKTLVKGDTAPLVIELPAYRLPSLRNALITTVDRASVFLRSAGSVILLISVVLWALATYPKLPENGYVDNENVMAQRALEYSIAGRVGKMLEPVFDPLGFDWKVNVGVLSSFAAREVLVSTLSIVYGIGEEGAEDELGLVQTLKQQTRPDGTPVFTVATSLSLLVFYVLAMQCLPTQAVTRRETGSWKWAAFQLVYMTVFAYVAAFVVYQLVA